MEFDLSRIELSRYDVKRGLVLPSTSSEQLAEFIGILAGDGYINSDSKKYSYIIEIAGNKVLDKDYLEHYIRNLAKQLFKIDCRIYYKKEENTTCVRILSKGLFHYLLQLGFKKGKKEQIEVPDWILRDRTLMISFIKGLVDTDGSLMLIKKSSKKSDYYPVISIRLKSNVMVNQVGHFLNNNGFTANVIENEVRIDKRGFNDTIISSLIVSGRKNLDLWMNLISFRNQKHLDKYDKYLKSLRILKVGMREFESLIVEA